MMENLAWPYAEALEYAERFVEEYEFEGEGPSRRPDENEKAMLLDMVNGLLGDESFLRLLYSSRDSLIQRQRASNIALQRKIENIRAVPSPTQP